MDGAQLAELVARAVAWRDADPEPATRREIDLLISRAVGAGATARAAVADLEDRFRAELGFGTAGLRGALGAGPNRMNRAVVIRAASGLAAYLQAAVQDPAGSEPPLVAVGYDARTDSDVFARDTCAVLVAAGCRAVLLPRPLPTPVLAFTVLRLHADAGVMVTASHNPPQDNGYKVYLGGRAEGPAGRGAQIVPPADAGIAAAITLAPPAIRVAISPDGWQVLGEDAVQAYLAGVAALTDRSAPPDVDIVLTPLHGVGGDLAVKAFVAAGFPAPYLVPEQAAPDPAFPTVSFPNPEEEGALDLALAAARARGAELVIATDPDADRCAVALPEPAVGPGRWRRLHGDEVGALLGEYLLSRRPPGLTVASSIVSSQLLARIAEAGGHRHVETLTGFKWLTRVPGLDYAYEEALGYCVAPGLVRDKDGISAALLVAELAGRLKARGRTLLDALDDLARRFGLHATGQFSVRVQDLADIQVMLARLRSDPPSRLGGDAVLSADDLAEGVDGLPPTPGLRYRTAAGARVILRPSGTEPKLKAYTEVVLPVGAGAAAEDLAACRAEAGARLAELERDVTASLGLGVPSGQV